ncbi:NlpC/P60 family protein [Tabrizicola sp.]|uniref:C40 family peptidase n=1 Tax=Tabrizicola sp. TaxID=2005166 RepID=UPI00286B2EED|nr:NlpC/P60 family protein [Tabrizicola sp.]
MDRRVTPFSGRVAHVSLRGVVDAPLTEGEVAFVLEPVVDLLALPGGARDRQLLLGDAVTVIDRDAGHAFVQAAKDGYCGWVADAAVGVGMAPSHWVASPATHVYPEPRVQARERLALSLGARLAVVGVNGAWAETEWGFVPASHLRAIGDWASDAVSVAESLLGTPYLWGGNSRAGLDCSGLVQLALHAAGRVCPGDSDQQQGLGVAIAETAALVRGDLLFWQGHVAMVADADRLIHANGHTMSVVHEGIISATVRIAAQGGGPITARRRV